MWPSCGNVYVGVGVKGGGGEGPRTMILCREAESRKLP